MSQIGHMQVKRIDPFDMLIKWGDPFNLSPNPISSYRICGLYQKLLAPS